MKSQSKAFFFCLIFVTYGVSSFAQNGNSLFNDSIIHTIEINSIQSISYNTFHEILYDSYYPVFWESNSDAKDYFPASVEIDGITLDTIGVRYKGNSTFINAYSKYPIKLDLNEFVDGQKFDGIKKINLNNNLFDVTCMRSKLSFEIMTRTGIVAPRTAYAKVFINGSYRGLYTMVEQIDKTFVKNNFAPDTVGYLHKAFGLQIGFPIQSLDLSTLSYWVPLKTKKSTNNYQPLIDFINEANNASDTEFAANINETFDLQGFIKQQAVNMVLSERDHYCTASWNFYLYQNPLDNKWVMIPWDYDLAMGAIPSNIMNDPANPEIFDQDVCFLNKKIVNNPTLLQQYKDALCGILQFGMDSTWITGRITEISNLIESEVENDPHHHFEIPNFEYYLDNPYNIVGGNLNGYVIDPMRGYISNRFSTVINDLAANNYDCSSILPIELKFFNVQLIDNNRVRIDWQTISESNNNYFTIERSLSLNGVEWEEVAKVESKGNTGAPLDYQAIDENPYSGISYYRLKQTDFDGRFEYSKIKSVNIRGLSNSQINIYPSPTTNQITLKGNELVLNKLKIYNTIGEDVTSLTAVIQNNGSSAVIDVSRLLQGTYIVKTKTSITKFLKF